jgi:hypothetical protein
VSFVQLFDRKFANVSFPCRRYFDGIYHFEITRHTTLGTEVTATTLSHRVARDLSFTSEKIRKLIPYVDAGQAKPRWLFRGALPTAAGEAVHLEIGIGDPPHAFYFEVGEYAVRLESDQAADLADMLERLGDDLRLITGEQADQLNLTPALVADYMRRGPRW